MLNFAVLILGLATVVPAPAPTPTPQAPLKIIVTVQARALCNTLTHLALPVGYIANRNDDAFIATETSFAHLLRNLGDSSSPYVLPQRAPGVDQPIPSSPTSSQSERIDRALRLLHDKTSSNEDSDLYGGAAVLSAARTDRYVQQIYANLVLANEYLHQSWKDHPAGHDAKLDALRQRVQNVLDLQRALADRYESFVGTYFDNRGMVLLQSNTQLQEKMRDMLQQTLMAQATSADVSSSTSRPAVDINEDDVALAKRSASVSDIAQVLRGQELRMSSLAVRAYEECRQ